MVRRDEGKRGVEKGKLENTREKIKKTEVTRKYDEWRK